MGVGDVVVHDAEVAREGERELAAAAALLLRRASADSEQLGRSICLLYSALQFVRRISSYLVRPNLALYCFTALSIAA